MSHDFHHLANGVAPTLTGDRDAWKDEALCAQTAPDAFFPDKGGTTRDARKICAVCPVAEQCLQYAIANRETVGIWGGKTSHQLRKLIPRENHPVGVTRTAVARMKADGWTADEIAGELQLSVRHIERVLRET